MGKSTKWFLCWVRWICGKIYLYPKGPKLASNLEGMTIKWLTINEIMLSKEFKGIKFEFKNAN